VNKYFSLNIELDWIDIVRSIQPKHYCYVDKNNGDFIFSWGKLDELFQTTYVKNELNQFIEKHKNQYLFGFLNYDIKNTIIPNLASKNTDIHSFPDSIYFKPEHVIISKNGHLMYFGNEAGYKKVRGLKKVKVNQPKSSLNNLNLESNTSQKEYHNRITEIQNLLQNGDIYEMNYCMQFSKKDVKIDVIESYKTLKAKTKAPFSTLLKFDDFHIISGSPERFVNKSGNTLMSQPIKGTAPRSKDLKLDTEIKNELISNPKEISENIMIVDLVRNDLSKIALKNSVETLDLCKLYSFETVHQLISTVKSKIEPNLDFESILDALFPMGSMTGAPKFNAMKIIDEIESFKRGVYSGSIGYFTPNNNYDSNVVIRSIIYNELLKNVSVSVGGAITIKSEAKQEYKECLLKLDSIAASIKV
jgi:para-aminobenzoate synthetase component 1